MMLVCVGSVPQQHSNGAAVDPHCESVKLCALGKMPHSPPCVL